MKLLSAQTDEASLLGYGAEAMLLLEKRDFQALSDRFDYALRSGRSAAAAIEIDLQSCLAEFQAGSERPAAVPPSMVVKYFKTNSSNLLAVVECVFTAPEGCPLLAVLIVTSSGEDKYITLEGVSLFRAKPVA